ncbi:MAG: hypothetical protein WBI91_00250 [Coriobacteriia bacterium]
MSLERIRERLRQDRETFDQHKAHEDRWFTLRLVMGYSSAAMLVVFLVASALVIFNAESFPSEIVKAAGAAFFVDALGLVISIWKIVFNPDFMTKLAPITQLADAERDALAKSRATPTIAGQSLLILAAKYGAGDSWMDVAPLLRTRVQNDQLRVKASNAELGGDPAPNVLKNLELVFSLAGRTYSRTIPENGMLAIPSP